MGYPISSRLNSILQLNAGDPTLQRVDLRELANAAASALGQSSAAVQPYFESVSGSTLLSTIVGDLLKLLAHDSVVRDLLTTGHLAKLLSRWSTLVKTGDYRLLGLPHECFDNLSREERREFLSIGGTYDIDPEVMHHPEAREMLEREVRIGSGGAK